MSKTGLQAMNQQSNMAQWIEQIEDCRSSGQTVTEWCAANGISHTNSNANKTRDQPRRVSLSPCFSGRSFCNDPSSAFHMTSFVYMRNLAKLDTYVSLILLNYAKGQVQKLKAEGFIKSWNIGLSSEYVVAGSPTRQGGSKSILY